MLLPLFLLLFLDGFPTGSNLGGDEVVLGAVKKNFLCSSMAEVLDKRGSGAPVCVWNAEKCDEFGRVVELRSYLVTGEIPNQLRDLNKLQTLFLHTNLLSGKIPVSLGNLTGLVSLDLSNNALIGEIPPEFSTLHRLSLLNLFINRLHGSIPEFFNSQRFPS
ncbi:hypothetical protein ZOSMA_35G00570 [Zostera marina]|uniref:Leucine-rich repeat-containing N-terminal plant-type domain-containing protein n=1 Tax=Zostera marina TaxID=29655 RepID=A0A0K9P8Z8_ZOSMR|nr:hypothetical protein ZOSMA_35G00570 [Zostera marina]